ncbi:MAG: hypothetical protein JWN41_991 [Thermoleophilia bacterium]|nr:hypothetical protein [Thermoleophilia bacterium]
MTQRSAAMTDYDLVDAMRIQRALLEPSTEELARMRTAAHSTFAKTASRMQPLPSASRRRMRISVVAVAAVALAIAAGVAFGPENGASNHAVRLPAPATAAAAFEQAAVAAGDATWTPLGAGAYFHTLSSTFDPVIPARPADPAKQVAGMYRWSQNGSTEQWLDVNGRGRSIRTDGSIGDPDLFPGLMRDKKTHLIQGYGGYVDRHGRQVNNPPRRSTEDQLKYPDTVNVTDRPRGTSKDTATMWMRQATGYVTDGAQKYRRPDLAGKNLTVQAQIETWGASLADLKRLDDLHGAELRAGVRELLDQKDANTLVYPNAGSYDVTTASRASGTRVRRAIKLLGSAPLAPDARQELFRVLAAEPKGKLTPSAKDRLGRTGTRVTFETVYDRDRPARRITAAKAWQLAGGHQKIPAAFKPYYDLPAFHEFRRWYVDVIFDRESGELLQYAYYSRWRSNGRVPSPVGYPRATDIKFHSGESMGETDSGIYGVRERVTDIRPAAPVCGVDATPCVPSAKVLIRK